MPLYFVCHRHLQSWWEGVRLKEQGLHIAMSCMFLWAPIHGLKMFWSFLHTSLWLHKSCSLNFSLNSTKCCCWQSSSANLFVWAKRVPHWSPNVSLNAVFFVYYLEENHAQRSSGFSWDADEHQKEVGEMLSSYIPSLGMEQKQPSLNSLLRSELPIWDNRS